MRYQRFFLVLTFICSVIIIQQNAFSEELSSIHQTNLNLVDRLARSEEIQKAMLMEMRTRFEAMNVKFEAMNAKIEEGQKAILVEMRTRFEGVNKRFETIDKRFEAIDKRFEAIDKRFEAIDKRFEAIDRRFERMENQINNRINAVESRVSQQGTLIIAMLAAIISLIAYVIWDRNTAFNKAFKEAFIKIENLFEIHVEKYHNVEPIAHKENKSSIAPQNKGKTAETDNFSIPQNIQEKFRDVVNFMNQFPEMRPVMQMT